MHQPVSLPINQIVPTPGCCLGVKNAQSLRPYPQFLTISALTNGGASEYAALLATLTHRWSNGISVRAAYTWAHVLNDVDAPARADAAPIQNVYNLNAQWGTAMTNIPQRFSLSDVYALPVGAGGRYLRDTPVLSQVVGHWTRMRPRNSFSKAVSLTKLRGECCRRSRRQTWLIAFPFI